MARFQTDSRVGLDLIDLNAALPSITSTDPDGRASWLANPQFDLPRTENTTICNESSIPSRLVIGCSKDFIVDEQGFEETAFYLGCEPAVILPGLYHDLMLGPNWRQSADVIATWLSKL